MPPLKPDHISPTDEENAAINAGIAADSDTFELDAEWFKRARPAVEVDPELGHDTSVTQSSPRKESVTIFLDSDVAQHLRSSGRGWQTRLNKVLRQAVFGTDG